MSHQKRILLIYPLTGLSGSYVRHIPLSILYASVDCIKAGYAIDILDVRLSPDTWKTDISAKLSDDTVAIGFSVITGTPVKSSLEMTRWVKTEYPRISTVWGGPHISVHGKEVLNEACIDYAINSYGSQALAQLIKHLCCDRDALPPKSIPGLIFRDEECGRTIENPPENVFEIIDYHDIPYHLIEENLHRYGQLDNAEQIFPMYSSVGCPYQCAFCSSPAQYKNMRHKYVLVPPQEVADHIEYVHQKYNATYIYFIDDDSFVDLAHVEAIIDEINRRTIRVKLGFRGARINEIKQMDDAYLSKLAQAGTNILHIGAESGSQRILDVMRKNITVQDIVEVNRKLARHPEITCGYNWVIGLPGETLEDLEMTRSLIMQLMEENSAAVMFAPNKYRPLPGTELYETAITYGYVPPKTLEGWTEVEVEGDYRFPWYTDQFACMINMMQVASYFIDDKLTKLPSGNTFKYSVIKLISKIYAPIARFRFRTGCAALLFEYWIYNYIARCFRK